MVFKDTKGNDIPRTLSYVKDLKKFFEDIVKARDIAEPKFVLGADGVDQLSPRPILQWYNHTVGQKYLGGSAYFKIERHVIHQIKVLNETNSLM